MKMGGFKLLFHPPHSAIHELTMYIVTESIGEMLIITRQRIHGLQLKKAASTLAYLPYTALPLNDLPSYGCGV